MCSQNNPLNCEKAVKLCQPQRRDEKGSSVTAAKAERMIQICVWLNPKRNQKIGNSQPSLEQRKVQRLSRYSFSVFNDDDDDNYTTKNTD